MKRVAAIKDFFGINHLTNKDVSGLLVKTKLPTERISSKFGLLILSKNTTENKEIVHDVGYGKARYDNDNLPKGHGQFEPRNTNMLFTTSDVKQRYAPPDDKKEEPNTPDEEVVIKEAVTISEVAPEQELSKVLAFFRDDSTDRAARYMNRPPLTFYFDTLSPINDSRQRDSEPKLSGGQIEDLDEIIIEASKQPEAKSYLSYDPDSETIPIEDQELKCEPEYTDNFKFDESIEKKYSVEHASFKKSSNALEYLKSIRSGKVKPSSPHLQEESAYPLKPRILLDSRGFKNYSRQVPDWDSCRHVDIINYLKRSIIYHNYDVLAVNKPYGLASHCDSKRDQLDMNNLMQEIASNMRIDKVYLAHRLDKTTTGVLLFATSQERADQLNKLFKSDQIKKTYWCVVRGIPDPDEAIIDIPIGENSIAGKMRSCLAPEKIEKERQLSKRYREARRAITEYCVIQSHKQVSLVEVKPRTGVKHQIRCHLGLGIGKPILGDHKYSHVGKIAPQELSVPVLNLLHLRQPKVRTLPIHLHAKTIVVPNIKPNGQNLFIEAPLPAHFKENLKSLRLLSKEVIENM